MRYDEFRRQWDSNSVSQVCAVHQKPIISKYQHSTKFGNTVHVVSAYFRNSLLARKIKHLVNIETQHKPSSSVSDLRARGPRFDTLSRHLLSFLLSLIREGLLAKDVLFSASKLLRRSKPAQE